MLMPWDGLLAAGSTIAGAFINKSASDNATEATVDNARRQEALQKEFAQHGLSWKIADAVRAGIHPLAALGASGPSYAPQMIDFKADPSIGNAVSQMGQDISRSMKATATEEQRQLAYVGLATAQADLDGKILDNQIRQAQLAKMTQTGPPFPGASDNFIPGQVSGRPLVKEKPLERVNSAPDRAAQEAGWRPDVSYSRTDTGLAPVVPESLSESLEDDFIGKILWRVRNQLLPNFTGTGKPSMRQLPKGSKDWNYSFWGQEWQPSRTKSISPWQRFKNWWNKK